MLILIFSCIWFVKETHLYVYSIHLHFKISVYVYIHAFTKKYVYDICKTLVPKLSGNIYCISICSNGQNIKFKEP